MGLGRGFTAVARRVPRLAGLVWIPAGWPVQTAVGRQALWLAARASELQKKRWLFALQKYPTSCRNIPTAITIMSMVYTIY